MMRLCFFLLFACTLGGIQAEQRAVTATSTVESRGSEEPWRYWLHLPEGYEADVEKRYPLMLYLHGSSRRGNELNTVKGYGPPAFLDKRSGFPMLVVSPQLPSGGWPADRLMDLLDELEATYRIDPSRVYLTGVSLGGQGVWALAAAAPERFAAMVPVCAWGSLSLAEVLTDLPIKAFHGTEDKIIAIEPHRELIDRIRELGGNAELIEIEGGTHSDIVYPIYRDESLYQWMLEHRRE